MAVAKISKINIITKIEEQEKIMKEIQEAGLLQVQEQNDQKLNQVDMQEKISQNDYCLAQVRFCLNFLSEFDTRKKSLAEKLNSKIKITKKELIERIKNFDFKLFKKIQDAQSKINGSTNLIEKLETENIELAPWKNLSFTPNTKHFPLKINFRLFSLNKRIIEDFKKSLKEKLPLSELQIVNGNKKEIKAALIFHIECNNKVDKILNKFNARSEEIPIIETTVAEHIRMSEKKTKEALERLESEKLAALKLASKMTDLKIIHDHFIWERDRLSAQQKAINGWKIFSIIGWIKKSDIRTLEKRLSAITKNYIIEEIEPEKGEQTPIAYQNSWWASPFEFVTGIYGAPKNGSPDPTPFLAPFFIVFFGLCLTDAGYGIILALLAWLGIKIVKPKKETKKMFLVLLYGGLMTFVAGMLVGGWFGIAIDNINEGYAKTFFTKLRLIDPVKDPISMLLFSLGLGIFQVISGKIISLWWKIKNKNIASALLDDAVWLYFIASMLAWGANQTGIIDLEIAKYLTWIGVIGIILTQGRKAKNPVLKLINGVISLYGLVSYISDILSYSRLLALGLATGIIAMVINLIASLTVEMIPYLGYVIAFLLIIGGHIFNIAINTLGAFIHSSRLQFVEFFPKFMEGGGVNLAPVRKDNKYTRII